MWRTRSSRLAQTVLATRAGPTAESTRTYSGRVSSGTRHRNGCSLATMRRPSSVRHSPSTTAGMAWMTVLSGRTPACDASLNRILSKELPDGCECHRRMKIPSANELLTEQPALHPRRQRIAMTRDLLQRGDRLNERPNEEIKASKCCMPIITKSTFVRWVAQNSPDKLKRQTGTGNRLP